MSYLRRGVAGFLILVMALGTLAAWPPASARAEPDKQYPIIFIPGFGGTFLLSDKNWVNGECGNAPYIVWLDAAQVLTSSLLWSDIQRLRLREDGLTNAEDPCVRVGPVMREAAVTTNNGLDVHARKLLDVAPIYKGLTDWLHSQGYNEGDRGWLEVFPYDFRKSADYNTDRLEPVVAEVLRRTGAPKVILLAHSYGGLIARTFVARHGSKKVAAMVTIGTPYLGSPRIAQAMTVGWDFGTGLNMAWSQKLAPNWPAAYHFLPPAEYFEPYGSEGFYTEEDKVTGQRYSSQKFQLSSFRNQFNRALYDQALQWRQNTYDKWDHDVEQHVIAGFTNDRTDTVDIDKVNTDHSLTMIRFRRVTTQECSFFGLYCRDVDKYYGQLGGGDNTVPIGSALLGTMPAFPAQTMSGPHRVLNSAIGEFDYWLASGPTAKHSDLPNIPEVQTMLWAILKQVQAGGKKRPEPLKIASPPVLQVDFGQPFTHALQVSGGVPPYRWSPRFRLPAGFALDPNTGVISGTGATPGRAYLYVEVRDAADHARTFELLMVVGQPLGLTMSQSPLPLGTRGVAYKAQAMGSGGWEPYTWSVVKGSLPPGVSLPTSGRYPFIQGTPTEAGTWDFTLQLQDARGTTVTKDLSLSVQWLTPEIISTSLPKFRVGRSADVDFRFRPGVRPYELTFQWEGGAAPPWLNQERMSQGLFTGRPDVPGTTKFTATVTDALGQKASRELTMEVEPDPEQTFHITGQKELDLPVNWGLAFSRPRFSALYGREPITWSVAGDLPDGLKLITDKRFLLLDGVPTRPGIFPFTFTARDAAGQLASHPVTVTVYSAPTILAAELPAATASLPYQAQLEAEGGKPPLKWGLVLMNHLMPPEGVGVHADSGFVGGTPKDEGTYPIRVRVADALGRSAERDFTLEVGPVPSLAITTPALPDGQVGQAYTASLGATYGKPPYQWSVPFSSLPPGLKLDARTGVISGQPQQTGTYDFTVAVRDIAYNAANRRFSLTVAGTTGPGSDGLGTGPGTGPGSDPGTGPGTDPGTGPVIEDRACPPGGTPFGAPQDGFIGSVGGNVATGYDFARQMPLGFGRGHLTLSDTLPWQLLSGQIQDLGVGQFASDRAIPEGGWQSAAPAVAGHVYLIKLADGRIAQVAVQTREQSPYGGVGFTFRWALATGAAAGGADPVTAPTGLSARVNGDAVSLTWQAPAPLPCGLSGYAVQRAQAPGQAAGAAVLATVTETGYTDRGLQPGTYYYIVTSVLANGGKGAASAEARADVAAVRLPPDNPRQLTARVADGAVELNWQAPATPQGPITGYNIFRSQRAGVVAATPLNPLPVTATQYADRAVTAGSTYTYRVAPVYAGGRQGAESEAAAATLPAVTDCTPSPGGTPFAGPRAGALGTVSGLMSNGFDFASGSGLTYGRGDLSLDDSPPYQLYATEIRSLGPGSFSALLSYSDSGWKTAVPAAENHVYLVRTAGGQVLQVVTGSFQRSPYGSLGLPFQWAPATGPAQPPVTCGGAGAAPTALQAVAQNGTVQLTWQAPPSPDAPVTGYNVLRGTSAGGQGSSPINPQPLAELSYTDRTVQPGTTYYYQVACVLADGRQGAASAEVAVAVGGCRPGTAAFGRTRAGSLGSVAGLISSGFDFTRGSGLTYGRGDLSLSDTAPWTLSAAAIQDLGPGSFRSDVTFSESAWTQSQTLLDNRVYLVRTAAGQLVQVATGGRQTSSYGSIGIPFQWAPADDDCSP